MALAVLVMAALFGCAGEDLSKTASKASTSVSPEEAMDLKQEVYSFRVESFGKNSKVRWGLEGARASVVLDKINISDLKVVYYGEDMTFTIFADKAVYDKNTQDIELSENIIGKTSDGGELRTSYAKWTSTTEEITTDREVTVKRENISCNGIGMVTKPRLKKVKFNESIVVVIQPDKKITCDGPFEIDHEKNIAIFRNDVHILDKDSETLTDKLTVHLDPKTNEIARVITEGNVKVVHRGDVEDLGKMTF